MEGIYYSNVVPRGPAILTLMGLVFDKVHFTGAYLPTSGFDMKELEKEIARIEAVPRDHDTAQLIGLLNFVKHVPTLQGFCEFQPDTSNIFSDRRFSQDTIMQMYDSIYGPRREGWAPMISSGHTKGMPGSDESVAYRGEFHQFANAICESARTGIPLINDVPGLPVFSDVASPVDDAKALAGLISVLCMRLLLPEIPVLAPSDLMEFRDESKKELRAFRRAMLTYAAELNKSLDQDAEAADIEKKAQFFVETEIGPRLEDLRDTIGKKSFGWMGRSALTIFPTVGAGYLSGGSYGAMATLLTTGATQIGLEFKSRNAKNEAKKSGLYYLLKAETKTRGR
jgi:hypothetical protein